MWNKCLDEYISKNVVNSFQFNSVEKHFIYTHREIKKRKKEKHFMGSPFLRLFLCRKSLRNGFLISFVPLHLLAAENNQDFAQRIHCSSELENPFSADNS